MTAIVKSLAFLLLVAHALAHCPVARAGQKRARAKQKANSQSVKPQNVKAQNAEAASLYCGQAESGAAHERDKKLAEDVLARLLVALDGSLTTVMERNLRKLAWPPCFQFDDEEDINAYVDLRNSRGVPLRNSQGRLIPYAGITGSYMAEVIEGDPDRLAIGLGHELAHLALGHLLPASGRGGNDFLRRAFTRAAELDADRLGMKLALGAGFSFRGATEIWKRLDELGIEPSRFGAVGHDHPSWKDRLAEMDKERSTLWRSMSVFENGVFFLTAEQYETAALSFAAVVKQFPDAWDAWANLGYARLMQYADALTEEDIKLFGIGQIAAPGFYRRPAWLEAKVRGIDTALWQEAVSALREALRLKESLALKDPLLLVRGALAVAYLIKPPDIDRPEESRSESLQDATKHFEEAMTLARANPRPEYADQAALLVNAAVAALARKDVRGAKNLLEGATTLGGQDPGIATAISYNRAVALSLSEKIEERRAAVDELKNYLTTASPASAWWSSARSLYGRLAAELAIAPVADEDLRARQDRVRLITTVRVASGAVVTLSEPASDVERRLGRARPEPLAGAGRVARLRYPQHGVNLVVADQVMAISLGRDNSPPLEVRGAGLGAKSTRVRVGMPQAELESILGKIGSPYAVHGLDDAEGAGAPYRFYRELGLAVRYKASRVERLVVVQIPDYALDN